MTPQQVIREANAIGGRNGVGISHALENRIIGTKSRGVYEAPGMELLGQGLTYVYQSVLDRRATKLFEHLSDLISDQIYDGRFFDPATTAAMKRSRSSRSRRPARSPSARTRATVFFLKMTGVQKSLYNEADSSMEADATGGEAYRRAAARRDFTDRIDARAARLPRAAGRAVGVPASPAGDGAPSRRRPAARLAAAAADERLHRVAPARRRGAARKLAAVRRRARRSSRSCSFSELQPAAPR